MSNGNGVSRGDRNRNARLSRLRVFRTPDMVRKSLRGQRWVLASGRRTRSVPGVTGLGGGEVPKQLAGGVRDQGWEEMGRHHVHHFRL